MSAHAPLRALLATGDRDLEARLANGLAAEGVAIVARSLDADSLLQEADAGGAGDERPEVLLVSTGLLGLTDTTLLGLRERGHPVVLLAPDAAQAAAFEGLAPALLTSAPPAAVAEALREARDGRPVRGAAGAPGEAPPSVRTEDRGGGRTLVVTSGKGAPGKTTLAIAVAATLGADGTPVVLVDADLRGGDVAPALGLDPRRSLSTLAAGVGPRAERLTGALQPGPGCDVLAGLERPLRDPAPARDLAVAAVAALRARYAHVVVDAGAPADAALLAGADDVLLVAGADLVSVWNAQAVARARAEHGPAWHAVVNRRERRGHYSAADVTDALGLPVRGVVREDRGAARHALEAHVPLHAGGWRVGRQVRGLVAALAARSAGVTVREAPIPGHVAVEA